MSDQSQTSTPTPTAPEPPTPAGLGTPPPAEPPKPAEPAAPEAPKAPEAPAPLAETDIKLPEGFTLDEKGLDPFLGVMNDSKLTPQERAQKLIDMQIEREKAIAEKGQRDFADLRASWVDTVKKDPELGGAKFDTTMANIGRVMDKYADQEARDALGITGAGDNPAIVRMFNKMAADLTEPGPAPGQPGGDQRSLADKLYTKGQNK